MASTKMRLVDMRSDTLTLPSLRMKESIMAAPLGDDVVGEDPSVNALQEHVASIMGKEEALFVPSGTMGNLICVMSHCWSRGAEVIVGDSTHIYIYEQGGISQFGGVHSRSIKNLPDGTFSLEELDLLIRGDDPHYPITSLVCIENTHNMKGGKVLPLEWIDKLGQKCRDLGIPLHVDGARLWNASVALNVPPARLVRDASSVTVCLSKGLGAPVGSVIAGSKEFIARARRLRKSLGGGMRQSGVLAAMGMLAIQSANTTLQKDHDRLTSIAKGICDLGNPHLQLDLKGVHTNILMLNLTHPSLTAGIFCKRMEEVTDKEEATLQERIICRIWPISEKQVRFVSNCNMLDADVQSVIKKISYILEELQN